MASEIATKAARLPFGLRESAVILSRTTTARERTWDEAQHARLRANDVQTCVTGDSRGGLSALAAGAQRHEASHRTAAGCRSDRR